MHSNSISNAECVMVYTPFFLDDFSLQLLYFVPNVSVSNDISNNKILTTLTSLNGKKINMEYNILYYVINIHNV
jgi:hypothetical protein